MFSFTEQTRHSKSTIDTEIKYTGIKLLFFFFQNNKNSSSVNELYCHYMREPVIIERVGKPGNWGAAILTSIHHKEHQKIKSESESSHSLNQFCAALLHIKRLQDRTVHSYI